MKRLFKKNQIIIATLAVMIAVAAVNRCLLASAKEANIIGPVKNFDNRTIAGKRRKLAQTKAPEAMMALLDTALSAGLKADYVLFDSWFSNPRSRGKTGKNGYFGPRMGFTLSGILTDMVSILSRLRSRPIWGRCLTRRRPIGGQEKGESA